MCEQIVKILEGAWGNFKEYYDSNARKYSRGYYNKRLQELGEKKVKKVKSEVKNSHWICWNESDMMVQLGRFFYDQLKIATDLNNKALLNIEMHFDKNLNHANFEGYSFHNKLWRVSSILKDKLGDSRKFPKLDLIITREDNFGPFMLCAEAKSFHASVRNDTIENAVEKDIRTLAAIKECGITERIAYIVFDDYYYNMKNPKDVEKIIGDYAKKYKIMNELKVMYHDSSCKIPK